MSLVWCVPVVAAAVAAGLVLARVRALEEAAFGLRAEVALLATTLRRPLRRLREGAVEIDATVAEFRARHTLDGAPDRSANGER
ncbi:MAG TPA: hypothetical protein VIL48_14280 [Acidimicrobiales bacterium]